MHARSEELRKVSVHSSQDSSLATLQALGEFCVSRSEGRSSQPRSEKNPLGPLAS